LIGGIRTRSSGWLAIVLPGFLLRALIPIGFMPLFAPGLNGGLGVGMMLCDGGAHHAGNVVSPHQSPDKSPDKSPDNDSSPSGGGSPAHNDHSLCPYGASSALAAPSNCSIVPVTLQRSDDPPLSVAQILHFNVAARAQSPRAPPIGV